MPQTIKASDGTELDAGIVNLSKAIRARESKGDYNAVGDAGTSKGAYQFNGSNFENWAKEASLDPNDFSPVNQDKVAYYKIKSFKDKGYSPEQVAAAWNAGEGKIKNDAWKKNVGTTTINGKEIGYDTPGYVTAVMQEFQRAKGNTGGFNATPFSNPAGGSTASPGQVNFSGVQTPAQPHTDFLGQVGDDISKRSTEAGAAGSKALTGVGNLLQGNVAQGGQDIFNGALQTAGALGGLVGDVTTTALEHTPVVGTAVKGIENLIGQGVGALAKTEAGQSVIKSVSEWAAKHPELSADIGAGFNIVTAIPILKGLGAVKNVAMDATAQALKGIAEKGVAKDLTSVISRTRPGATYISRNPKVIQTLVDERALPDIENGKFTTSVAKQRIEQSINKIEENELQPLLENGNSPAVRSRMPFDQIVKDAEATATELQEDFAPIKKELELVRKRFGDYPTIAQINEAKRIVSRKISEASYNSPDASAMKVARSVLQKGVEDGAKALNLPNVAEINQRMSNLIRADKALGYIEGKAVRMGTAGGLIQDVATAGGEMVGNASGIPIAGALLGRESGGFVGKKLAGIKTGLLNRTGKNAIRTPIKQSGIKAAKGLLSAEVQNSTATDR